MPVPGWAALPVLVTLVSLGIAAFGFFWDVATHIDDGRDSGPFANVAHYPILIGLGGVALAGFLAAVLGADARDKAAIAWAPGWRIPLGGALLLLCGGLAMIGFPLDDVWHRIFGQDVTLWGPTHVLMIGGASLAPIAAWLLLVEGRCASGRPEAGRLRLLGWEVQLAGATLIGLSTLQLEFGFGVPQFQLAFHPILIALAASVGLVAARLRLGRGGALAATGAYLIVMTPMVLIVGPVFGHTFLHFPIYLVEAVLVELAGLVLVRRGPVAFGAGAGALIGTVGVAAEWAWSQVAMPIAWPASLLPEAPLLALVAAVAGGLIGAHLGGALASPRRPSGMPRFVPAAALAALIACLAIPLHTTSGPQIRADVTLDRAPGREAVATVKLDPPGAAEDAKWFHAMAWQGGGSRLVHLDEIATGTYRDGGADPGPRRLEGDAAPAHGQRDPRDAGLHAGRLGDPGQGGPGRRALRPRVPARPRGPAPRGARRRVVAHRRRLRHPRRRRARLAGGDRGGGHALRAPQRRRSRVTVQPGGRPGVLRGMRRMLIITATLAVFAAPLSSVAAAKTSKADKREAKKECRDLRGDTKATREAFKARVPQLRRVRQGEGRGGQGRAQEGQAQRRAGLPRRAHRRRGGVQGQVPQLRQVRLGEGQGQARGAGRGGRRRRGGPDQRREGVRHRAVGRPQGLRGQVRHQPQQAQRLRKVRLPEGARRRGGGRRRLLADVARRARRDRPPGAPLVLTLFDTLSAAKIVSPL